MGPDTHRSLDHNVVRERLAFGYLDDGRVALTDDVSEISLVPTRRGVGIKDHVAGEEERRSRGDEFDLTANLVARVVFGQFDDTAVDTQCSSSLDYQFPVDGQPSRDAHGRAVPDEEIQHLDVLECRRRFDVAAPCTADEGVVIGVIGEHPIGAAAWLIPISWMSPLTACLSHPLKIVSVHRRHAKNL